ncbi:MULTISPECIES: hypothetical protein [unclassified Pseudomonas]|uniref:hypothetical protein n=1 Tax=unclassified Pseudomonas TaxID=196821 RepID=UPI00224887BE|nr:hypothetical protein [Pseudomonas sp. DCB_BG]MCX2708347.1 hypothetical protein [Pseudomonas sp. DCB_BG]
MTTKILYTETSDDYKIRYAEFQMFEGTVCYQILNSDPQIAKAEIAELIESVKQHSCSNLVIKFGFCWAEYDLHGYTTHTPLKREDFLPKEPLQFFPSMGLPYTAEILVEDHRLWKYIHHVHHKPEVQGTLREFDLKFGRRVPKDYYGNYDYSRYPGGYSPSAAVTGDY